MRAMAAAASLAAVLGLAQEIPAIAPFSTAQPGGALPAGWREQRLPKAAPAQAALVRDEGTSVLRVSSSNAAGGVVHPLSGTSPAAMRLAWRWKIDRVVAGGDLGRKGGDDFAARVYVFFDFPVGELPLADRIKVLLARSLFGEDLPTAAICYVWDNRQPVGTALWSPYSSRVRMVVVESGDERAGQWREAARDLDADFRAAFGGHWNKPTPPVNGLAVGNDTDQTGGSATAWFGDLRLATGT